MKRTQKLKLTIEDFVIETTYDKLPQQVKYLADRLDTCTEWFDMKQHDCVVMNSGASLFVSVEYIGCRPKKPQPIKTIFGYDAEEFMKKQYK